MVRNVLISLVLLLSAAVVYGQEPQDIKPIIQSIQVKEVVPDSLLMGESPDKPLDLGESEFLLLLLNDSVSKLDVESSQDGADKAEYRTLPGFPASSFGAKRNSLHILFKGIPVDGGRIEFGAGLSSKGFTYFSSFDNEFYKGNFAGIDDCCVVFYDKDDIVYMVSVAFPVQNTWVSVKNRYLKFKELLQDKYEVEPLLVTEKLSTSYPEGCGREVWGFESEMSTYESVFDVPGGNIDLSVKHDRSSSKLYVRIDYIDRINFIMKQQYEMDDI